MLGEFITRSVRFALRPSLRWADALSVFATLAVPAWFWIKEAPIPEWGPGFIAILILSIVVALIFLRVLSAPYFVWKVDKEALQRLQSTLADSSRRRRVFFEDRFLSDRYELSKKINQYAIANLAPTHFAKFDANEHITALAGEAGFYWGDNNFRRYWDTFQMGFRNVVRGAEFIEDNKENISQQHFTALSDRFELDLRAMQTGAMAMMFQLTENQEHSIAYSAKMDELTQKYQHVMAEGMPTTLWALERQPTSEEIEEED
ncbi:hypothetical protein [Oricola nitratireducens]|uniref:hypothetical protein n=1 Tax=Oricola nitratireducens TaxID=2775868 RepID=UPI00186747A2|nr:hypothetical protein [Oricola nitratireducens]